MTYSWATPATFQDGTGNGPTATELDNLANDLGFLHQEFPIRAYLWHKDSTVIAGGNLAVSVGSVQDFGHFAKQAPSEDADSFEQSFILLAGTYTVHFLGQTTTASGLIDWELDGVSIKDGQDWYSGGTVTNVEKTVASVIVSETGRHVLTGTVNGKNGSSSDYDISLTSIWFEPGSDVT